MNTPMRAAKRAVGAMIQRPLGGTSPGVRINFLEGGMIVQYPEAEKRRMKLAETAPLDISYTAQIALVQELLHGDEESWKDGDDAKLDRLLDRVRRIEEKIRGRQEETEYHALSMRSVLCKDMTDLEKVLEKARDAQAKIKKLHEAGEHLLHDASPLDLAC